MIITGLKKLFFISLLLLFSNSLYGQAVLKFEKEYLRLDTLSLDDGFVVCQAKYKNAGDAPLYLTSYVSTCPCLEVEFSEEALAPGDSSFVTLKYSYKYEGKFRQSATLFYFQDGEEDGARARLTILGYVTDKKKKNQ